MKTSGQQSDLVHRHMQSHLRRVAQAQGRVDTSTPTAMLNSIKVKDRTKQKVSTPCGNKGVKCNKDNALRYVSVKKKHSEGQMRVLDRLEPTETHKTGEISMSHGRGCAQEKRVFPMTASVPCSSPGRVAEPHTHLLELCPEQQNTGSRWHLYHTPTGRLTGFLKERQKHGLTGQQQSRKSPWRPPYTSPVDGPAAGKNVSAQHPDTDSSTDTYRQSVATTENNSTSQTIGTAVKQSLEEQAPSHAAYSVAVPDHGTECAVHSQSRASITVIEPLQTHDKASPEPRNYSRGREVVIEGAEMRLKASTLTKSNDRVKLEYQQQVLETRYLQFVSEVTQDILSRHVLSRPALDLLCKTHMDKHKHKLREDEMMKRLDQLKTQIGLQ